MEIIVAKPPTVGKLLVTASQKSLHYSIPVDFTSRSCTPSEVPNNSNKGLINPTQAIQRLLWDSKEMFYFCIHCNQALYPMTQCHGSRDSTTPLSCKF